MGSEQTTREQTTNKRFSFERWDFLQSTLCKVRELLPSLFPDTVPCIRLSKVRHFLHKENLAVSCSCCVCMITGQLGYIIVHSSSPLSRPCLLLTHANLLWPVGKRWSLSHPLPSHIISISLSLLHLLHHPFSSSSASFLPTSSTATDLHSCICVRSRPWLHREANLFLPFLY